MVILGVKMLDCEFWCIHPMNSLQSGENWELMKALVAGSIPLMVCSSWFISGHDYFCSKFLHSSLPWMSFGIFLHLQYSSGFRRHCPDQDNPNSWGGYNIHCIVWIELRSVRYTFVKFKMIPNDCMETRTLFMINCSKMFDMCSMCHSLLNNNCNW